MAYAIVETGGKQLRVEPGRFYDVELLHVNPEETISIDRVLYVQNNDDIQIGQPFVAGATVEATILRHFRGRKIIVYKMRPKKKTRKKQGHRQELTRLMINSIHINGCVLEAEELVETPRPVLVSALEPEVVPIAETIVDEMPSEVQSEPIESAVEAVTAEAVAAEAVAIEAEEVTDSAEETESAD